MFTYSIYVLSLCTECPSVTYSQALKYELNDISFYRTMHA